MSGLYRKGHMLLIVDGGLDCKWEEISGRLRPKGDHLLSPWCSLGAGARSKTTQRDPKRTRRPVDGFFNFTGSSIQRIRVRTDFVFDNCWIFITPTVSANSAEPPRGRLAKREPTQLNFRQSVLVHLSHFCHCASCRFLLSSLFKL